MSEPPCSFLGGTDPAPGLPNQNRQSPRHSTTQTRGFHCQVTSISPQGQEEGSWSKYPFFQCKAYNSSCPREPLPTSRGPGCNPCWAQQLPHPSAGLTSPSTEVLQKKGKPSPRALWRSIPFSWHPALSQNPSCTTPPHQNPACSPSTSVPGRVWRVADTQKG